MMSIEARLVAKLDKGKHWVFTGVPDIGGYGLLWDNRRKNNSKAHRIAYELWVGPIPKGQQVHHKCKVRLCCRPSHLMVMTPEEHGRFHHRKTHCLRGHEFTPENTREGRQRVCLACEMIHRKKFYDVNKAKLNRRKGQARRRARKEAQGEV